MSQKMRKNVCFALAAILSTGLLVLAAAPLAAHPGDRDQAPRVVAHFLELSEQQLLEWREIRAATAAAVLPLAEQIRASEAELRELFGSESPDPGAVGELVLTIRSAQEEVRAIHEGAAADFEAILIEEQAQRLQAVRGAAPLCRVLPAFKAVHLL